MSLCMRGDVALSGNFGFELDLTKMSPAELEQAAALVSRVRSFRDLTFSGTFWRLLSPFEGSDTAWSFVSRDQREVLFCAYRTLSVPNTAPLRVRLRGILPDVWYVSENGSRYHGAVLMNHGLTVRHAGDFSSFVLRLRAE